MLYQRSRWYETSLYYLRNHWQTIASVIWAICCLECGDVSKSMENLILQSRHPKLRNRKC